MSDLFPVCEGVYLPLEWPYEPRCNDVCEVFLFKFFNELFQVESAVGDNAEHFDTGTDTFIGVSKEGKDIVPGRHITGAVPYVDDILASVQKG